MNEEDPERDCATEEEEEEDLFKARRRERKDKRWKIKDKICKICPLPEDDLLVSSEREEREKERERARERRGGCLVCLRAP